MLGWLALTYDLVIVAVAVFDAWNSKLPQAVSIERHFGGRFAVGAETDVRIEIANHTSRDLSFMVKDEYPPQMELIGNGGEMCGQELKGDEREIGRRENQQSCGSAEFLRGMAKLELHVSKS